MSTISKWIRNIHRWLAIPLLAALAVTAITTISTGSTPDWVAAFGIGSLLSLLFTGLFLFGKHYVSRLRRSIKNKQHRSGEVKTLYA
jgi:heme A synthase